MALSRQHGTTKSRRLADRSSCRDPTLEAAQRYTELDEVSTVTTGSQPSTCSDDIVMSLI